MPDVRWGPSFDLTTTISIGHYPALPSQENEPSPASPRITSCECIPDSTPTLDNNVPTPTRRFRSPAWHPIYRTASLQRPVLFAAKASGFYPKANFKSSHMTVVCCRFPLGSPKPSQSRPSTLCCSGHLHQQTPIQILHPSS